MLNNIFRREFLKRTAGAVSSCLFFPLLNSKSKSKGGYINNGINDYVPALLYPSESIIYKNQLIEFKTTYDFYDLTKRII